MGREKSPHGGRGLKERSGILNCEQNGVTESSRSFNWLGQNGLLK